MPTLIGNNRAIAAVQRALGTASPSHAWLFVGPEGVGKAALARWLAQAVNCQEQGTRNKGQGTEPCGECAQCDRIARGIHSDVPTVSIPVAEGNEPQHKDISVDQVREVERAVALAPFEGRTRVVIVDPADAMSGQAQNAFLKTLEEPPPNAVFVLVATQVDALLPTVRSRCALIEFGLVSTAEIEQALGERGVEEERGRLLARLGTGRPEKALALADDESSLEKRGEALEQARALAAMPMGDLMDLGERLAQQFRRDREAVLERLDGWLSWWRDLLLLSATGIDSGDGVANVDMLDALREEAGRYEREDVVAFVQALRECRRRLEGNVQARIALDAALVRVPRAPAAMRNEK